MPPKEIQHEWIRFIATKPSQRELSDWIAIKAAEVGWSDLDLTEALVLGVQKPDLPEPDERGIN